MCGIVGYVGPKEAESILYDGLHKLEYRGYDSGGIAIIDHDKKINICKKSGKLDELAKALKAHHLAGNVGIGHTRWATHGSPTDINAHPHKSPSGKFVIVHNGIIENFHEIKEKYLQGHQFISETDTEVMAHLIELFYEGDLYAAVRKTLDVVEGSYALVVISSEEPDKIIVSRKDSPLVIGLGEGENFIASDVPALLAHTRKCIYLESGQLATIMADKVEIRDLAGNLVDMPVNEIQWDEQAAEKGGYEHFMIKEIFEQPEAFKKTLSGRIHDGKIRFEEFTLTADEVKKWRNIYIVACGTAYHSGLVAKTILEKTMQLPVFVEVASEFRYRNPMISDETLVIVISQSGETADTMAALREAKSKGATVVAVTNVVGSAISREADQVVYLWAGPEISVASTKAYTTMIIALYMIAFYLGDLAGRFSLADHQAEIKGLELLPEQAQAVLTPEYVQHIADIAKVIKDTEHIFYIGRGIDWAVAQEGALKLKEISYIHAEAYAAGELKHGTLALISENTPVIGIGLQQSTYDKAMSNVQEVLARGAKVITLEQEGKGTPLAGTIRMTIPACEDLLSAIIGAIPLQLLAYYVAKERGCDIDQPRNLAKSVTVE